MIKMFDSSKKALVTKIMRFVEINHYKNQIITKVIA